MIVANCVSKVFGETAESSIYAIKDISLTIYNGELVVILGHSGAGKTTLINVLSTLDLPTSGKIVFNDVDLAKLKGKRLTRFRRENIGYIFQQFHLISTLNVYENIEVAANLARADKHDIYKMISSVNLEGKEKKYPYQLSGGEQQRVAIARALIKKPKVLFCDEPTGALDEDNGRNVLSLIAEIKEAFNVTVIIVSHNPVIAKMADRMITMNNGEILTNNVKRYVL